MIGYFVRHPNAANLLMLAAVLLGFSVLSSMERETFPEFTPSRVTVGVVYPGASAIDVDESICQELDRALDSTTELDELECVSTEGQASATLTMEEGGDIIQFYNDILSTVSGLNNLPTDAEPPTVAVAARTEQVALLAVSGIDGDDQLLRYADRLASDLSALPLVFDAVVAGISEGEYRVTFDQLALRQYGLSARDVSDAIAARSLRQPLGTVETRQTDLALRFDDVRRTASDLESLVILETDSGGIVRLGDIGSVTLEPARAELRSFVDGQRAAIIQISKNQDDDAIDSFAQVEAYIAGETARLSAPFAITVINNATETINERLNLVLRNTGQGLVFVLLLMTLFFSLREAFWISMTLPVSFLGGLFVLNALGITLNMISLVALLMAVGLIMDDSIVIADNIAKWRGRVSLKEAAIRGVREVMPGVVSSFLTTACVFGPLMFLSGEMGRILQVVPLVLLITLTVSLIEAFLVLPNHLSHVSIDPERAARRLLPRWTEAVKERFVLPTVRRLVAWRYLTVGTVFAVLIVTVGLIVSGTVKVTGFPTVEADTVEARFALTPGAPIERTEAVVDRLLEALSEVDALYTPATQNRQPLVERVLVRYATNADVKGAGANAATITVDLLTSTERSVAADAVLDAWRDAAGPIPDLMQSRFVQTSAAPGGSDLDVQLTSRDLEALESASAELYRRLLARDDVLDAYSDFSGRQPEVRTQLNPLGYAAGLTPQNLAGQLRAAFAGTETDQFRDGFSDRTVQVALGDTVATVSALAAYPIRLPDGRLTELQTVADIELTTSYTQITRQNGAAIARIIGRIDREATTSSVLSRTIIEDIWPSMRDAFPEVDIGIGGATEAQQETQSSILVALMLGVVGIYIILAYQFHSYTMPVIVLLALPFAMIGTVFGHMLLGIDLAMPSFVGFASLAGIVVNNAILFLTFFEKAAANRSIVDAAIGAVSHRFRPILLSFSTTFVGLLPIMFATSPQAQVMVPLVSAVAFGLLSSTLLIIFVLPSALAIYFDFADVEKWLKTRSQREPDVGEDALGRPIETNGPTVS
ncbi:MAG: efflux RND transporter permease subunit [Pseudomonadota bacterium]